MGNISIDEAEKMLNDIACSLPKEFYKELNGGILLLPGIKISPHAVNNDLYIMGEYVSSSSMGRYINIYYGSLYKVYGYLTDKEFKEKMREVLLHEFTHHLESLAGEKWLEEEDDRKLKEYYKNYKGGC